MDIGSHIKEFRTQRKLSRKALSELAGISASYIEEIESNKKKPTIDTLMKLGAVYNVTISELIGEIENETPPELKRMLDNAKQLPQDKLEYLNWFIEAFALGKKHTLVERGPGDSYTYNADKKPPTEADVKRFDELYEEFKEIARKDPIQRKKFEDMGLRFYFDEE
jgi:transcriptional regulator with XRE-family HTH domain